VRANCTQAVCSICNHLKRRHPGSFALCNLLGSVCIGPLLGKRAFDGTVFVLSSTPKSGPIWDRFFSLPPRAKAHEQGIADRQLSFAEDANAQCAKTIVAFCRRRLKRSSSKQSVTAIQPFKARLGLKPRVDFTELMRQPRRDFASDGGKVSAKPHGTDSLSQFC
jgi:hypothetical protein